MNEANFDAAGLRASGPFRTLCMSVMTWRSATLALSFIAFSIAWACTPVASFAGQSPTTPSDFLMSARENGELEAKAGCDPKYAGHESFDIAVIRFSEDGELEDFHQRVAAEQCIEMAKGRNPNGVIVVVFVHGWRHNAAWDLPTSE